MPLFSPQNPSGGSELSLRNRERDTPQQRTMFTATKTGETPHGIPPDERHLPSEMQLADAEVSVGFVLQERVHRTEEHAEPARGVLESDVREIGSVGEHHVP